MSVTPEPVTFDPFGVPAGEAGEQFWRGLVSSLFAQIEQNGWDQPNSLWAVLGPVATAARAEAGTLRDVLNVTDPDGTHTLYAVEQVAVFHDNGRRTLPGVVAPSGTAAIMLITEAWVTSVSLPDGISEQEARDAGQRWRMSEEQRPSKSPDRIEIRQAMVMEPDGSGYSLSYRRGDDPTDPSVLDVIPGENLTGVLKDLLRRCYQLPVDPDVTVGEVLGTVLMVGLTQLVQQNPNADTSSIVYASLHLAAQLLDALDTPYDPDPRDPELAAIFHGTPNLTAQLPDMVEHNATGPLFLAARRAARMNWDDFFAQPGANRWLRTDKTGATLTTASREWYGSGHLSRFVAERLPPWRVAYTDMHRTIGDMSPFIGATLSELGWEPRTRGHSNT